MGHDLQDRSTDPSAWKPLFNGNIAHTVNTLQPIGGWSPDSTEGQVLAQVYHYDQLNRLRTARGIKGLTAANDWDIVTDAITERYLSDYTYDANGNIETAFRHNNEGVRYDGLHYHYHDSDGRRKRNRLYHLRDLSLDNVVVAPDPDDIKQTLEAFESAEELVHLDNNYGYDELGNLVRDDREYISNIQWTVAGKVRAVERSGTGALPLSFGYGASGQRIVKQVGDDPLGSGIGYREYYIRDAQGNIMATYKLSTTNGYSLALNDRPLYGSSRLGSFQLNEEMYDHAELADHGPEVVQPVDINYELTDHLGNVTTVVTGRLLDGNGGGTPKQAEVISAQGYEPFGSLLPGRNYSSNTYRHGFNGMEKDDEVHNATGTSYDFGARIYDPRIGRFLSVDPLGIKLPKYSPYAFALNTPIMFIDKNGEWPGVTYMFFKIEAGIGFFLDGLSYIRQSGVARDEVGKTHFRMVHSGSFSHNDPVTDQVIFGAGVSMTGGVEQSWKAETFWGDQVGWQNTTASVDVAAGPGVSIGVGYKRVALEFGVGLEAKAQARTSYIEESISLTYDEADVVNARSRGNTSWGLANKSASKDKSGRFWANVTIDVGKDMTTTNVKVFSTDGVMWQSEAYQQEATKAEEEDNR